MKKTFSTLFGLLIIAFLVYYNPKLVEFLSFRIIIGALLGILILQLTSLFSNSKIAQFILCLCLLLSLICLLLSFRVELVTPIFTSLLLMCIVIFFGKYLKDYNPLKGKV